jgi:hypothetical protein
MDALSVKLPRLLRAKLAEEARRRNVSQSAIVRESIEQALATASSEPRPLSCADIAGDLAGCFRSGRHDLATNKALLDSAMLESRPRAAKRRR